MTDTLPGPVPTDGRTYDAAELRILDAAHRVFSVQGTAGARMQEIADEAGVNKSMLHYYFRSKARLADAVFERAVRHTFSQFAASLDSDEPIDIFVHEMVVADLQMFRDYPYLAGFLVNEMHQNPERCREAVRYAAYNGRARFQAKLDAAIAKGEIAPITVEEFAVLTLSLMIFPSVGDGLMRAYLELSEDQWKETMEHQAEFTTRFILKAIRP
ncbi:MAG: TetR/AcrR family transcriptional regulator [Bacteroidota bacterium]